MTPPIEESGEESVPAQWRPQTLYDFRGMPDGPRGYKVGVTKKGRVGSKRKLDEYSTQVRMFVTLRDMACMVMSTVSDALIGFSSVDY